MYNVLKAIKEIYPEINGGYGYAPTQPNGKFWNNPIDGLSWENKQFPKPTWEQINSKLSNVLLQEAKDKKLAELKEIRNTSDQAPLRGIQAYEVVLDETFNKTKTNNLVFFLFDTQPVDTPVRNPLAILARVYRKGHDNPDYYLPYKCDIEENNTTRKGIIALTYDIAQTIENHMEARGSTNSVFKTYYETVINNCSTIEEVEAVNFGLNDNSSRLIV